MEKLSVGLKSLRLLNNETAAAYNRLASLLLPNSNLVEDIDASDLQTIDVFKTSSVVSDITLLTQRIFELERDNATLRYMSENTSFDAELKAEKFKENVKKQLLDRKINTWELPTQFDLEYFTLVYHPDFVYDICQFLIDTCNLGKVEPASIWLDLVDTYGLVTDVIKERYEPVDDTTRNLI